MSMSMSKGMFVLYLKMFCLRKFNIENENFEKLCIFFSVFVKSSIRHTHDIMVFWNRTIMILNKDDHES